MADKKVSELGVASALDGSEVLLVVQGATSKQVATKEVAKFGYQDIQSATASTKTLALSDIGAWIRSTVAQTITVPANGVVAFPVGTTLNGVQAGTGSVTVAAHSGVTINLPSEYNAKTRAKGACWRLVKVAANEWDLIGDLEAV